MATEDGNRLVSALVRGVSVLRCFTPNAQELSAKELGERTGLPKPTLFRLLDTLCELGLLRYSERVSKYVAGVSLLNLSAPVLARMTIRQLARPAMEDLADHIKAQVQLAVGVASDLTCVEVVQGTGSKVYRPEVGVHVSLSRTASGRAYLCTLAEAERRRIVAELAAQDPKKGKLLAERLVDARKDIERHGFCRSHGDLHREIESIAVTMNRPVDGETWVFAASMPVFSPQYKELETEVGPRLIAAVRGVEAALGGVA